MFVAFFFLLRSKFVGKGGNLAKLLVGNFNLLKLILGWGLIFLKKFVIYTIMLFVELC